MNLYTVNLNYIDYLREFDTRVSLVSKQDSSRLRPYVGVVYHLNSHFYFAPLSSPKQRFNRMKNRIGFIKISEGKMGAILLNNMIPVHDNLLIHIPLKTDINKLDHQEVLYRALLNDQLNWINKPNHQNMILKNAAKLYALIRSTNSQTSPHLIEVSCNFEVLEFAAKIWHEFNLVELYFLEDTYICI